MKRIALCIGNNDYTELSRLSCAVGDATNVSELLSEMGFEISLHCNLARKQMLKCIWDFCDSLDDYDLGLLYYAGHGFNCDSDNILAPIDLSIQNHPAQTRLESVPLSEVLAAMGKSVNTTKVIILDSCRENMGYRGAFRDFSPMIAPKGSIIAFSTSPGQTARENTTSGHGKYTEALLRYIGLPRVPIETVFKKVREQLVVETGGGQIPWEHTSLIGDVYLNPDTIFDGHEYGESALADCNFVFSKNSQLAVIVEKLKSYNWYTQERAIRSIKGVNFQDARSSELFVLGRNIVQAAEGDCFVASEFINAFHQNHGIPQEAKTHILNGMAYEVYFDRENNLRNYFKLASINQIMRLIESDEFHSSREFILNALLPISDRVLYLPGQNEVMDLVVMLRCDTEHENIFYVDRISYKGKTIYKLNPEVTIFTKTEKNRFESYIRNEVVAPSGYVRFNYSVDISSDAVFSIPSMMDISLRYEPNQ